VYQAQQAPQAQQPNYDLRHLTTTSSTSDELARKQSSKEPSPLQSIIPRFETYRGELKFYLGEIQRAFAADGAGAGGFRYVGATGRQLVQRMMPLFYDLLASHADTGGNMPRWGSALDGPPPSGEPTGTESVVNQREQAVMLALNAIAFAAPRDSETSATPGWIDPAVYGPVQLTAGGAEYTFAGYAPQPFITEVLAHNNHTLDPADVAALEGIIGTFTDTTDPAQAETQLRDAFNALLPSDQPIAVAIELYNPNDPAAGAVIDPFALHNGQFGISIKGVRDTSGIESESPIYPLYSPAVFEDPFGPSAARFPGRTFQTFAVTAQTNNAIFNGVASKKAMAFDFALPQPDTDKDITVRLWRRGKGLDGVPFTADDAPPATSATPGAWHVVDQMELKLPVPTLSDVLDNNNDFNGDGDVTPDEWDIAAGSDYWSSAFRDTSVARYMGDSPGDNPFLDVAEKDMFGDAAGTIGRARWGMAADLTYDTDKHYTGTLGTQTLGNASWREGGSAGVVDPDLPISPPNSPPRFGPITPLMTMNAGAAATLPIFDPAAAPETTDLRPASYPTVGFMLFTPRFAHVRIDNGGGAVSEWPMSRTLGEQWRVDRSLMSSPSGTLLRGAAKLGLYPADFGHMPIFDNTGDVKPGSYFDAVGAVPWGLLVFDYFTTINPEAPGVDPLAVSGRINVNTAPWTLLANLPLLGPVGATAATAELPIRTRGAAHVLTTGVAPLAADPAPSFWDPQVGVLVGEHTADDGVTKIPRFFGVEAVAVQNSQKGRPKAPVTGNVRWRLGNWLAQSAAAYRDGVQYLPDTGAVADYGVYADSQARGGGKYLDAGGAVSDVTAYRPTFYGTTGGVRGAPASSAATAQPTEFGFVTVGELLNVKGFDSTLPGNLPGGLAASTATTTTLGQGDFVKAVSLVALLDTQWLTTRSNTFTVYTSVIDRQAPQKSVRAQVTVDRSSILPRLEYAHLDAGGNVNQIYPLVPVTIMTGNGDRRPLRADNDYAKPRILSEQRGSYVNARFE
jgi:hypothetical protein